MIEKALLLGLASGGACLATCGLLVASSLAGERADLRQSTTLLLVFLLGRLLGYIGWAIVSWLLGSAILRNPGGLTAFASADLILGGWLVYYGVYAPPNHSQESCPGSTPKYWTRLMAGRQSLLRSGTWGMLSGSQVCPPFLAAIAEAGRTGSLGRSLLFFLAFYLGTGIWFVPFPFIGMLGRFRQVAQVARFCAVPLGAYYIYSGFIAIAGGRVFYG